MSLFSLFTHQRSSDQQYRQPAFAARSTNDRGAHGAILVALCGDALDADVISLACTMARARRIPLVHAVYVVDVPRSFAVTDELPNAQDAAHTAFEAAAKEATAFDIAIVTEYIQSRNSADALVRVARSDQYDLLVMGLASREDDTAVDPTEMVDDVLRRAPCRVLIVRDARLAA